MAAAVYAVMPSALGRDALYALLAWTPVTAIAIGVRWHRPTHTVVWRLFAAGLGASAVGDTLALAYRHGLHREPFPGPASACYLAAFLLLIAALATLGPAERTRDLAGILDAALVSTGLGLIAWTFVVSPAVGSGLPLVAQLFNAAYSVSAAVLLALLARLLTTPGSRGLAYWLILAASGMCLASTVAYQALTVVLGGWLPPGHPGVTLADAGLLGSLGLFVAAALHPSMRRLSDAGSPPGHSPSTTPARLVLLGAATLIAPATLAVQLLTDGPGNTWAIVIGSAVMSLLVLARMALLVVWTHRQARRLAALADTDALTGALNRRAWHRQLDAELARAARRRGPLSIALVDFDDFKAFNDAYGHPAGDHALSLACSSWRARLRGGDTLARLGGDEFAVLLPDCDVAGGLAAVASLHVATPPGHSVSIGVADWSGSEDAQTLTARADAALYEAKRRGRDQIVAALRESGPFQGSAPR